jgi:hypothetical protein
VDASHDARFDEEAQGDNCVHRVIIMWIIYCIGAVYVGLILVEGVVLSLYFGHAPEIGLQSADHTPHPRGSGTKG